MCVKGRHTDFSFWARIKRTVLNVCTALVFGFIDALVFALGFLSFAPILAATVGILLSGAFAWWGHLILLVISLASLAGVIVQYVYYNW